MDILDVQFPLARQSAHSVKGALKTALGRVLLPLMRARTEELRAGRLGATLSLRDRLMIAALVDRHEKLGTLEQLNGLHDWLWSSGQAVHFHEQAQARFDTWWLQQHSAVLAPLQTLFDARPGALHTLIEIGCGSGLVLADVAQRMPQLQRLIGLDLSTEQTARNARRYEANARLQFASGDAATWLQQHAERGSVCFTNAGVLEYFPERKLRALLQHFATLSPAAFACVEPIDSQHELARELTSHSYGAERSWSHNYPHLFADCGFHVLWQQELDFAGVRWLLVVAQARE